MFTFQKVEELWNFLLLSHPAKDSYLNYSFEPGDGRNSWLNDGEDQGQPTMFLARKNSREPLIQSEYFSPLSLYLIELLQTHGRGNIKIISILKFQNLKLIKYY